MKDLLRDAAAWVNNSVVAAAEFLALDKGINEALDGAGGGAYSPTVALTIGGKGIQDAYSETVAVVGNVSGQATVSNIAAHRLRITGGSTVTDRLTIQLSADAEGVSREITIDQILPGCDIYARDENNAVIASGSFFNGDTQLCYTIKFERLGGVWVATHRSGDPVGERSATTITPSNTTANTLGNADTFCSADDPAQPLQGGYLFTLPRGENGTRRRIHFGYIKDAAVLVKYGASIIHLYQVWHGGERDITLEFIYVNGWRLDGVRRSDLPKGRQTLPITNLPAGGNSVTIDTDIYDTVAVDAPVSHALGDVVFVLSEPRYEHQELKIHFSAITGKNNDPVISVHPGATNLIVSQVVFDQQTMPYLVFEDDKYWGGGKAATLELRVVNGSWRHARFSF